MRTTAVDSRILVLTVGTGNAKNLEDSLYVPLQRSISSGDWDRIVLLPSQSTVAQAFELQRRVDGLAVEVCAIPGADDENDADASFAHFDAVLGKLIDVDGVDPGAITLDFTRGTKAMSAALVLAGMSRGIPVLRYIEGERGERGMVIPGTEKIREVRTIVASARWQISLAERFMLRGNFEAACVMLHEALSDTGGLPESLRSQLNAYHYVAAVYAAWDRFDFDGALGLLKAHKEATAEAGRFRPTDSMENWLEKLAHRPPRDSHLEMADYLRLLACDILANAERRYRDGHFEDAGVRWYRVLELIGQARLFARGYDSGRLPAGDQKVREFNARLKRKKSQPLGFKKLGKLTAGRLQVARFLKYLGDPLASCLFGEDKKEYVKNRNRGILLHGFDANASKVSPSAASMISRNLKKILVMDSVEAAGRLATARSLDFSGYHTDLQ
ncbi:MAG: TIGR02710 family CRISPR-associated CARF protein [Bacteroidota bacterium]|nr:TIGR02710 family CRISPR-associated CARF protein [Bacteroidota bacterium]